MIRSFGDRATFEDLRARGRRARRGPLSVVYVTTGASQEVRVAYAIGRRVGNAVVRNRIRRRLRAAFAAIDATGAVLAPGSYLVSATTRAAAEPFPALVEHLSEAVAAATLVPERP